MEKIKLELEPQFVQAIVELIATPDFQNRTTIIAEIQKQVKNQKSESQVEAEN